MYMSLDDLRKKLKNPEDNGQFAYQFQLDAAEVGINVNIVNDLHEVDATLVDGNENLLNTYVNVVSRIITQTNENKRQGIRPPAAYSRLPLYIHAPFYREKDFEIDTDTRIITVPGDFNKNGVGVVGDHLAELLFFKVPRFFDVVDLYKCKIYIYWHNVAQKEYAEPHIDEPIAVYPDGDTLNFGWYLTDEATEVAGQIEFAVEFVIRNEHSEVTFRLETQPAKLTVKSAIDMNADGVEVDNQEDVIYSRSIYSNVVNILTAAPAAIIKNLPSGQDLNLGQDGTITLFADAILPETDLNSHEMVFEWNWNGVMLDQPDAVRLNNGELIADDSILYELQTEKIAQFSQPLKSEQGEVTYSYDLVTGELEEDINPSEEGWYEEDNGEYVLTEDVEVIDEKAYYTRVANDANVVAAPDSTYKALTTNVPGAYQVYIGNKVTDPNSANYGGIRYVYTNTAYIQPAAPVTIDNKEMPSITYLDNWQNYKPELAAYVEGVNGDIKFDWYFIPMGTETAELKATFGVGDENVEQVLDSDNRPTGIYRCVYDPSGGSTLPEVVSNADYRGYYYVGVRNIKNNTITRDASKQCFVEVMPVAIPFGGVTLTADENVPHRFKVKVLNPQHSGLVYELNATIRTTYEADGQTRSKETPVYFEGTNTRRYFNAKAGGDNGEVVFDLNETTVNRAGLVENSVYTLFITVLPISQKGNTPLERTPVTLQNNIEVPNRTPATLSNLQY